MQNGTDVNAPYYKAKCEENKVIKAQQEEMNKHRKRAKMANEEKVQNKMQDGKVRTNNDEKRRVKARNNADQEDHQVEASALACPTSCGRDNVFVILSDICPRRALVDIYLHEALRLLEKSQIKEGVWNGKTEAIFDQIRALCRRLRCRDFLPMMEDREFIGKLYGQEIKKPKKECFHKALQYGKTMFEEHERCILLYNCQSKGGTKSKHCVEMRFTKDCKVEEIEFIDNQIGKKLLLEDFPVNCLNSIQMIPTKNLGNLRQDCGKNLCMNEDVGKDKNAVVNDILKNLSRKAGGKA